MPKPRKFNIRKVRDRILILCEGAKTEPNYFKAIKNDKSLENKLTALRIEVYDTVYNTALELVKQAVRLKEAAWLEMNPYDCIWVVFDRDGYHKHPEAFDLAKKHDIDIAFSSISFEYWFILHFARINIPFPRSRQAENYLREQAYYPGYGKNHPHYNKLRHLTSQAIANAKWLRQTTGYDGTKPRYELNPYTDVDILVAYLLYL